VRAPRAPRQIFPAPDEWRMFHGSQYC
jgi:hypothetical protein